jgi:hypothetical protein
MLDLGERGANDVSFTQRMRKVSRLGLSAVGKLLSEDLPLCLRFRERGPRALSEEKSPSAVARDGCESASKLAGSCSTGWRKQDEKKRKKAILIAIRFTAATVYQGGARSQLRQNGVPKRF